MGKTFAVAMVFKRPINNHTQTEERIMLHIVRSCETKGDAYLYAYDKEKETRFQDGGCYMKAVIEVTPDDSTVTDAVGFAEWCKMLPYNFIRGIGWEDPVTQTPFTTAQLWDKYQKEVKP
jgi:hypothetical protein